MARDFAAGFYRSRAWRRTRRACFEAAHGLCERCLRRGEVVAGEIVHHKVHLTPENIGDPAISLSPSNLELLCRDCHAAEHSGRAFEQRVGFDADGNLVRRGSDAVQGKG